MRWIFICLVLLAQSSAWAKREQVWIPLTVTGFWGGETQIKLEATLYTPEGDGPFPVAIYSHGSAGHVAPSVTIRPETLAKAFAAHGFALLAPMRRGRGASEGRSGESSGCDFSESAKGVAEAIVDTDAVIAYVRTLPAIDAGRMVLVGASRGGLLSIVYESQRPGAFRGAINFVGGWKGASCLSGFNVSAFQTAGALTRTPTLWLYSENDPTYTPAMMRAGAAAYQEAGGNAEFHLYPPHAEGMNAHYLQNAPRIWRTDFTAYMVRLGFPLKPLVKPEADAREVLPSSGK